MYRVFRDQLRKESATYVHAMMKQPVDLLSEGTAGDYLQSVIAESEYSSPRGEHRYYVRKNVNIL